MSNPVISIDPHSSVPEAHLLMKEHGIRRLPVVDEGKLVGIITLGDVRGASPSEATPLNRLELAYLTDQIRVERVMTRQVVTVTEDTPLLVAARLMVDNKISALPVLSEEGTIEGIVTESDLFLVLVSMLEDEDEEALLASPRSERRPQTTAKALII